ncbi:hypothetical protein LOAG_15283 [Loa loa]|uniref:Uncharacterized protein n=1 Tax=Loa loa TaxID=7209 RepID=A0A1S0TG07_LOALO|nr:hypothetical protein LOAG_15283 [Loa loa]EFO13245.1 hypothetical protein LOAG_15283 [Loa loa]
MLSAVELLLYERRERHRRQKVVFGRDNLEFGDFASSREQINITHGVLDFHVSGPQVEYMKFSCPTGFHLLYGLKRLCYGGNSFFTGNMLNCCVFNYMVGKLKRVWKCSDYRFRMEVLSVRSVWPSVLN